jgi:NMT1-like family
VDRGAFLRLVGLAGAACGVVGHSPYRQWLVYRKSRTIIVTSAADPASYPLGDGVATLLARHLPESRALAARAADSIEIVKLLGSEQLDLAILTADDARDAYQGRGRFAGEGAFPLRALAVLGSYLFVCREDFPAPTARVFASTLAEHWRGEGVSLAGPDAGPRAPIPFHAGVPQAFPDVAARVVEAFSTETGGVRNVRIDIRRRDMAPEADVTLVGVLSMDIKPGDGAAWYSIRLLFGQREGRWSFLKAFHELPGAGPIWTEASGTYRALAERALGP